MAELLSDLKQPIAILPEYIASTPTTLHVKQHRHPKNKPFHHSTGMAICRWPENGSFRSQEGRGLFTVTNESTISDFRRHFFSSAGTPLFEISKKIGSVTFFVLPPGKGRKGVSRSALEAESLAVIATRWDSIRYKFDLYVKNGAGDGTGDGYGNEKEVKLEVRGQDKIRSRTNVYFKGRVVMVAFRVDAYASTTEMEWKVEVAKGLAISLASAIMPVLGMMLSGTGAR
ncbi:hypothetical protein BDW69DRAFT_190447 [Aspergillus filifer]